MRKITLGILAHVDGGKTTLSESVLYLTGKIRKLGRLTIKMHIWIIFRWKETEE